MIEKSDSKWISLAAASILGQAPRYQLEMRQVCRLRFSPKV
ncbi:MAG: hypothetical protein V3V31_09785 [Methylococcales bacterium]